MVFTERVGISEMGDKRIGLHLTAVFEVVDGKIASRREYYDSVDLARQLGIDPNLVIGGRRSGSMGSVKWDVAVSVGGSGTVGWPAPFL